MSLVPILYTSLLLFTILMVIILTVSYISYKIKNRSSESRESQAYDHLQYSRHIDTTKYLNSHRTAAPAVSSIKVVSGIKNPELKRTVTLPYYEPRRDSRTKILNSSDFDRSSRNSRTDEIHSSGERFTRYGEPKEEHGMSRTNPGSYKKRLEILNQVKQEEPPKEKLTVGGSGSIALPKYYENFKAIHYYTDEEDEYFYKPNRYYD